MLTISMPPLWLFVLASFVALSTIAESSRSKNRFFLFDFALISFYVSSCISTVHAYDFVTALPQLHLRTLFLLLYLPFRFAGRFAPDIITVSGIGMIIHCIESLVAFSISYREWIGLGFSSLVDFRSFVTLTVYRERPGNHAAIYIIAIAIGMYGMADVKRISRFKTIVCLSSIGLSAVCVVLSFSRALYLSAFICVVVSIWGLANRTYCRKKSIIYILSAVLLIVVITLMCIRPVASAVSDTVHFGTRLSQERSTSGRLAINTIALHLIPQSGLLGVGVSNYALEIRRLGLSAPPSMLTAHAFNTALEIVIEQGFFGLATLAAVLAGLTIILFARFRSGSGKALLGGSTALLLYGMSQTFVIADQATAMLLAVFCGAVANDGDQYD